MPINYSAEARKQFNATNADDPVLILLEISHVDLGVPVRITNNTEDVTHNSNVFTAMPFEIVPPDDLAQGQTRGQLIIDNVGKVLAQWVDSSNGGEGATVRIIQILFSDPDTIEWEMTLNLLSVQMTPFRISATLAFDDFLSLPGVTIFYRPGVAPGLFLMHWAESYVGEPFQVGVNDCAAFAERVLRQVFHMDIKLPTERSANNFGHSQLIERHRSHYTRPTDNPREGDMVLMRGKGRLNHIGIFCRVNNVDYVLHAFQPAGQVCLHRLRDLVDFGLKVDSFYQWVPK